MKMIEKCKRPSPGDFRPITVTSIGYRLFWGGVRDEIEDHLSRNGMVKDCQVGFTRGGRLEYNLFILQYLVERTYGIRRNYYKRLIIMALDFRKAFDTVWHEGIFQKLIQVNVTGNFLDTLKDMYQKTSVQ